MSATSSARSGRPPRPPRGLKRPFRVFYESVAADPRVRVRTVYEHFARERRDPDAVEVCIRHDVDFALNLVVPLAEYEHALGLSSTYYFLTDTAPYRIWESDVPRRVAELGHEVGLHSDHQYEAVALERDGLARIREDVEKLSALCGQRVVGMAWHGGRHMKAIGALNYDLYRSVEPADLGLEYHDRVFYVPETTKWSSDHLLSDGENNLRFVPGKVRATLAAAKRGESVLFVGHPIMMFPRRMCQPIEYPPYPHLSPPPPRTLLLDLKSCLAYNKAYLGERRIRRLRRLIGLLERLSGPR